MYCEARRQDTGSSQNVYNVVGSCVQGVTVGMSDEYLANIVSTQTTSSIAKRKELSQPF